MLMNTAQRGENRFRREIAGAMLALASAWLRDATIRRGNVIAILLWYGLYGLQ